jgi:formyl-CoA transferase
MVLAGREPLNWAGLPLNGTFRTTDGAIVLVGAFKPNPLRDICAALGIDDLSERPELATMSGQKEHRAFLQQIMRERFATKSTDHWIARLEQQDLLCAPVRTLSEALDDPQTEINGMLVDMQHPTQGPMQVVGSPLHMSGSPPELSRPAPTLGGDTDDILGELGLDAARIATLRESGVIA